MKPLDRDIVAHVAQTCLCLHAQRAARALARLFDKALKPYGLSNGQFSLLMALNRPEPPTIGELAPFLAMDRTSLTAALKPLQRRGLVGVEADRADRRSRRVRITAEGVALLEAALPSWRDTHARLDAALDADAPNRLRADMRRVPPIAAMLSASGMEPDGQPQD
ncbi:transcriptional regulator, MarR family [Rubrimonas cliftonensis]|uniref:Transcriptional regulator, MarR family n=1 Tax=Rubrimonas cliftonensis TaxID=89524 RepID=A0A1H4D806_9RHOB|nr:transcriptional regulator, MarR family [Rubrimonas cliftonensis]